MGNLVTSVHPWDQMESTEMALDVRGTSRHSLATESTLRSMADLKLNKMKAAIMITSRYFRPSNCFEHQKKAFPFTFPQFSLFRLYLTMIKDTIGNGTMPKSFVVVNSLTLSDPITQIG